MPKKLIVIGGVGTGTVMAATIEDIMRESAEWQLSGFLNDNMKAGEELNGFPVLGTPDEARRFAAQDYYFVFALVSTKKARERVQRFQSLGIPEERFPILKHPTAVVSSHVKLGYGVVLMPGVIISPDAVIGNHTHLYANSFVGHNTVVGSHCLIANSASIGAFITIKDGVHIGSNCSIVERVTIGEWSVVGLGSVVLKDVPPCTTVVGNPAKVIGSVNLEG